MYRSDGWRKLGGAVCDNARFVRQDLLDQIVWAEVMTVVTGHHEAGPSRMGCVFDRFS